MAKYHAVLWIDHHNAEVLQFDAEEVQSEKVRAHDHYTRQHASAVRTEHEFFGQVCDALAGITEILVTGSHVAQADFRHYVERHRPALVKEIAGWETVDHPSQGQLLAQARKFFVAHDRMTRK
jgi:stalled ribosome rescue protein Dom34